MVGTRSHQLEARQDTEAPPPPPPPTETIARATRGERQSRAAEAATTRVVRRSKSRQLEPTPVPQPARARDGNGGKGKGKKLAPVDEEEQHARSQLGAQEERATARIQEEVEEMRARPDQEDIDATLAIEYIPDLRLRAGKLVKILLDSRRDMETTRKDLQKPGSSVSRHLAVCEKDLNLAKSMFGTGEYISPQAVYEVLGTDEYHPVLYEANVAVMTKFFCTAQEGTERMYEELNAINRLFPQIIGEVITEENFALAQDLRTQTLISAFIMNQHKEDFRVDQYLSTLFFKDGVEGRWNETHPRNRTNYRPYGGDASVNQYGNWKFDTRNRIHELYDTIKSYPENGDGIDFEPLQEKYPWDKFAERMVAYFRRFLRDPKRQQDVEAAVKKAKAKAFGADSPGPEHRYTPEHLPPPPPPIVPDKGNMAPPPRASMSGQTASAMRKAKGKRKLPDPVEIAEIRKIAEGSSQELDNVLPENALPSSPNFTPHDPLPLDNEAARGESEPEDHAPGHSTAEGYIERLHRIQGESNKENIASKRRFIDPQQNRVSLTWDGDIQPTPPSPEGESKGKKRSNPEDEDDFQPDTREEDARRRKRSRVDIPEAHARPKQRQFGSTRNSGTSAPRTSGVSVLRASVASSTQMFGARDSFASSAGGALPHVDGDSGQEDDRRESLISLAGEISKTKMVKKSIMRERKGRVRWTDEQADKLVKLIAIYGTDWVRIHREGGEELGDRTNVNLKDKARNLKIQFLRAYQKLPPGFKRVTLSEKDRKQVEEEYGVDVAAAEEECQAPTLEEETDDDENDEEEG